MAFSRYIKKHLQTHKSEIPSSPYPDLQIHLRSSDTYLFYPAIHIVQYQLIVSSFGLQHFSHL
ncbi:unnamed protein product [Paramecium sonneborni]|uniref:Uncharacterized protein n=1 Tax=Paramecium sonneborni TaxID=65129 RepID=A0A8S1N5T4_9CILI|nr:unnamed protein product [Paramecium sonneborni]